MYNISQKAKELLKNNSRQTVTIEVSAGEDSFSIHEDRVLQGGLTIDRYANSGDRLEIGSAIAAELSLKIKNDDGLYNDVFFEGAELSITLGIKDWTDPTSEEESIPCGKFIIDTPPRSKSTIHIKALDYMIKLDKYVDLSLFTFPLSIRSMINRIAYLCDIDVSAKTSPNENYIIEKAPSTEALTYRNLVQWCAFITGTNAYFDGEGCLQFAWYEYTGEVISASDRYSSDLYEKDISITGLKYTNSDNETITKGVEGYMISYAGCDILQDNTILDDIFDVVEGFTFRPYEATIKPAPYLYPMDRIIFEDKNGIMHPGVINHVTCTMNANTYISGMSETSTSNTTVKPELTIPEKINQASIHGLYRTSKILPDQSTVNYIHDKPQLTDSKLVVMITAEGVGISNDGGTTWDYSFNFVTGAAIARTIQVDNAWINDLFAQNITATGTITGANLIGSRLKTTDTSDGYNVTVYPDGVNIYSNNPNTNIVGLNKYGLQIRVENANPQTGSNELGILLKEKTDDGYVVLKPIVYTDHEGNKIQGLGFDSTSGGGYGTGVWRIPQIATGSTVIQPSEFNVPQVILLTQVSYTFANIPKIAISCQYDDTYDSLEYDIKIVDVGLNYFEVIVQDRGQELSNGVLSLGRSDVKPITINWIAIS